MPKALVTDELWEVVEPLFPRKTWGIADVRISGDDA